MISADLGLDVLNNFVFNSSTDKFFFLKKIYFLNKYSVKYEFFQ